MIISITKARIIRHIIVIGGVKVLEPIGVVLDRVLGFSVVFSNSI